MKKIKVVDLFSGAGGLSLGFEKANYDVVAAFDSWDKAVNIYEKNFKHPIYLKDLSSLDDELFQLIESFNPDMIIGGPPCQDFSSAGKRDESLGRADLTISFAQIIQKVRPRFFLMENVTQVNKSKAFEKACHILADSNYGLTKVVLDASLTNVPQKRKRFFMFGELGGEDNAAESYFYDNLKSKPMTIRDYLGEQLGVEHYYRHPRNYNRRGIFSIDEPAPTMRGVNRPLPKGYQGHNKDTAPISDNIRALTTIERSLIQTFPLGFFDENIPKTHLEQMIGNAVPVNLAQYVGESIYRYLQNEELKKNTCKQLELF